MKPGRTDRRGSKKVDNRTSFLTFFSIFFRICFIAPRLDFVGEAELDNYRRLLQFDTLIPESCKKKN